MINSESVTLLPEDRHEGDMLEFNWDESGNEENEYGDNESNQGFRKVTTSVTNMDPYKTNTSFGTTSGNIVLKQVITFMENAYCVRPTPDGNHWAIGLQNGNINFFGIDKTENQFSISSLKCVSETYPVTDLEFITFEKENKSETKHLLLASYASGCIRLWHYTSPNARSRLVREWKEKYFVGTNDDSDVDRLNQILCVSVSGDTQRFVTGGDDHVIKVYEITSKSSIRTLHKGETHALQTGRASDAILSADFHTLRITAIKYHPFGKFDQKYSHIFISASWDNTVQIWDDRKNSSLWQYSGPHVCGSDGLDIDSQTNTIVTSSWKRDKAVLQIWKFNEFVLTSSTLDGRSIHGQYNIPCAEYYQEASQMASQGYVAQFILNGQYIIYGGSNHNLFRIVETSTFTSYAAMFNIKSAVISVGVVTINEKKGTKIAVVSAKEVMIFHTDSKALLRKPSALP